MGKKERKKPGRTHWWKVILGFQILPLWSPLSHTREGEAKSSLPSIAVEFCRKIKLNPWMMAGWGLEHPGLVGGSLHEVRVGIG